MRLGRPIEFDPDEVLEKAMQVFWSKGYDSTSLQDLLNAMNLSKSSFYQAFGSKHQLFQNCIIRYRELLTGEMMNHLEEAMSGMQFIEDILFTISNEAKDSAERRGCLILNSASEFAQTDRGIAKLVTEGIDKLKNVLLLAVKRAQREGDIPKRKQADALALYLFSSMSGLKTMVKAGADQAEVKRVIEVVLASCEQ